MWSRNSSHLLSKLVQLNPASLIQLSCNISKASRCPQEPPAKQSVCSPDKHPPPTPQIHQPTSHPTRPRLFHFMLPSTACRTRLLPRFIRVGHIKELKVSFWVVITFPRRRLLLQNAQRQQF